MTNYGTDMRMSQDMGFEDYVQQRLSSIESKVDKVVYAINGNGSPGLKSRVEQHSTYFKIIGAAVVASIPVALFIAPHIVIR